MTSYFVVVNDVRASGAAGRRKRGSGEESGRVVERNSAGNDVKIVGVIHNPIVSHYVVNPEVINDDVATDDNMKYDVINDYVIKQGLTLNNDNNNNKDNNDDDNNVVPTVPT